MLGFHNIILVMFVRSFVRSFVHVFISGDSFTICIFISSCRQHASVCCVRFLTRIDSSSPRSSVAFSTNFLLYSCCFVFVFLISDCALALHVPAMVRLESLLVPPQWRKRKLPPVLCSPNAAGELDGPTLRIDCKCTCHRLP